MLTLKGKKAVLDHLASLPSKKARKDFLIHAYMEGGKVNFCLDDGGLWNHSDTPNTGGGPGPESCIDSTYAIRDIKKGEELLDDYGIYEYTDWYNKILKEYGVDNSFFKVDAKKRENFLKRYQVTDISE